MRLEIAGLTVSYNGVAAVENVSLHVEAGSIAAVIGPNGAGKTTLLNAAMGVLPSIGTIRFDGIDIRKMDIETRVAAGISLVPELRNLFATMSVADNLRLGAYRHRSQGTATAARAMDEVFETFPPLRNRKEQLAGTLSGGERQMLAMGRALMARPKLLMLDEPSLGLAPLIVRDLFAIIANLRATGVSILLVEQNARAALRIADHAYVLETGRITLEGTNLADDPRVVATYLGKKGEIQALPSPPPLVGGGRGKGAATTPATSGS